MRKMWLLTLCCSVVLLQMPGCVQSTVCCPKDACWPSDPEISEFARSLDGDIYRPSDSSYVRINTWKLIRYLRKPGLIVLVKGVEDVRKCLKFAREHNILITIKSSGHSYNGRSTHDGSLQINMKHMRGLHVNLNSSRNPAGEITVETGNSWKEVYEEVQKFDRVIVGGADMTVSPGGYTQGGGHSPVSRSLGLAVDNVLEVQLVTVNGSLVTAREQETVINLSNGNTEIIGDGDLLWAIRGGGGGVWGVVISYTYKLHEKPQEFVFSNHYFSFISKNIPYGRDILKGLFKIIKKLPPQWGGYLIFNNYHKTPSTPYNLGFVQLALLHFGPWNLPSRSAVDEVINFTPYQLKTITNKTEFWDIFNSSESSARSYLAGSFLTNDSHKFDTWVDSMITLMTTEGLPYAHGCVGTILGGKASEGNTYTSVSPDFRSALLSMSCYTAWTDSRHDWAGVDGGHRLNDVLVKHGKGVYYNEPSYDLPKWKDLFWGGNYDRLLKIKQRWDPDSVLRCHHCVGSDDAPVPNTCSVGSTATHDVIWPLVTISLSLFIF